MIRLRSIQNVIRNGQTRYLWSHFFLRPLRRHQILNTAPVETAAQTDSSLEVHLLTGLAHIPDLLFAVKSFAMGFGRDFRLIVHGDRSLDERGKHLIERHFPQARVLTRDVSTPFVNSYLRNAGLERCIKFREKFVLAAKIFDTHIYSDSDRLFLLDTDTITYGHLDEIKSCAVAPLAQNLFARDPVCKPYIDFDFGFEIDPNLNSGSSMISRQTVDFSMIENWLANGMPMTDHFSEQTVFAALATRAGVDYLPPSYRVGANGGDPSEVFVHYCGHKFSAARSEMRRTGQKRVLKSLREFSDPSGSYPQNLK